MVRGAHASTDIFPTHTPPWAHYRDRPQGAGLEGLSSGPWLGSLPAPLGKAQRCVTRKSAGEQLAIFIVRRGEEWKPEVVNSSGQGQGWGSR